MTKSRFLKILTCYRLLFFQYNLLQHNIDLFTFAKINIGKNNADWLIKLAFKKYKSVFISTILDRSMEKPSKHNR